MHPLHSDLVAELVREEHLRAAAAHRTVVNGVHDEHADDSDTAPTLARRALGWFRGTAGVELRHHA